MPGDLLERFYPESRFGGFSDIDGVITFFSRVQALLTPEATVLDVGCGRGFGIREDSVPYRRELRTLRGKCRKVIGIDIDPVAETNPGIDEFHRILDAEPWPVSDGCIDLVLADFVLEHLQEPSFFFDQVSRVLKDQGFFCARTTNRLGYVSLLATLIPTRWHTKLLTRLQKNRQEIDIFPAYYAVNTSWSLRSALRDAGMDGVVYGYCAEPSYLEFSTPSYRIGKLLHAITPSLLADTLFVFARRTGPKTIGAEDVD